MSDLVSPADYRSSTTMGRASEFAAVAPDYVADLLVLRADPLADIANTQAIDMVVFNGRVFARDALDEMIAVVKRKARALNGAS